ncbi:MAG: sugar phosphate isomerase/epimerase [bacterium]|nr:sugar phosphate isomerase/epimerase [bacterium]
MELTIGSTTRPHNQLTYEEAFDRIAAAGYTDVAVFRNKNSTEVTSESRKEDVAGVRKAAADSGVNPSMLIGRTQLNLGLETAVDDYKRLIDNVADLGVTWLLDCGTSKEEFYEDYFELMRQAAPHAEQAGVHITMKPHGGISLTAEHLLAAVEKVQHPAFRICYDPGNVIHYTRGASRPETDLDRVAPHVSTGIIKDCALINGQPNVNVTAGDGLVDFDTVLLVLVEGGFEGPLYVECVGSTEPDAVDRDLAFTLGYVEGILAGL